LFVFLKQAFSAVGFDEKRFVEVKRLDAQE
jgi:hypothetical protein